MQLHSESKFAWVIGPMTGFSEAAIIAFPILKIRDYFTEFEKKIWYSGMFFGLRYILNMIIVFYVQKLSELKLNKNGKDTEDQIFGLNCRNIAELFYLLSIFTTIISIVGWLLVKLSEKDTRFDGIDDAEGVVFISGNFSDEYEIDAERKF